MKRCVAQVDTVEHVAFSGFILGNAGLTADTRGALVRAAKLPDWAFDCGHAMVSSDTQLRMWELVEHEVGDPHLALHIGGISTLGHFGLHDYMFSTAPTLAEGLARSEQHAGMITTNIGFEMVGESEDEANADVRLLSGRGRGREMATQFALAAVLTRARNATGVKVSPSRVRFRQAAPRRYRPFVEVFGTADIEFSAPTDQITFSTADLMLPMRTADPTLAAVLAETAAALPPPPRLEITWAGQVQQALIALLGEGRVTLNDVARYLATSSRSLQRHLADEGTTWTRELDRARRALIERHALKRPDYTQAALARRAGYSDAGALRRARHRWSE